MNIKGIINRIIYPNNYTSDAYIKYLRRKGATIGDGTRFIAPKKCNVDVGRAEYITIGKNCCLSLCTILAHDYSWYVFMGSHRDLLPDSGGEVVIGDNCFVGSGACILKDTHIGNNVIIGARAVVKGVIPDNTVWAGVPARQICTLDELYEKRKKSYIEDAFYRYRVITQIKQGEKCLLSEETINSQMGFVACCYLERTEDNYNRYIQKLEFNGIKNQSNIKKWFFETEPVFNGYLDFVRAYKIFYNIISDKDKI